MTFRARLGLFFVAALVTVQVLTAILVYEVTRSQLIDQGKQQLTVSAGAFLRQLDDISVRVADSVQVLARDFALRTAIAQSDRDTVLSALRNHGNRVGAARMMLVGLDGTIEADTQPRPGTGKFPFADLLDASLAHGTSAVVPMDEAAFWMVVVPVLAPGPIGFIAAAIPMDERFLARLQQDFALRTAIQLVTPGGAVLARSDPDVTLGALPPAPALVMVKGKEYVAYATRLHESQGNAPVFAILAFSLNDALRPYRAVASAWAMLLTIGLSVGLVGAWLIARGISRPVELLAATARRIEGGDYNPPPVPRQAGEIGQLSAAFVKMAHAIVGKSVANYCRRGSEESGSAYA